MMNLSENDTNSSRIPDIKEAYKNLHTALGDEAFKQYTALLRIYFSAKISKLKFDEDARKLLFTQDQLHLHNLFFLSLSSKNNSISIDSYENTANNLKYASQEMCLLNEDLIKDRVSITAIDHGLDDAENAVTDMIVIAVQTFLKNILTAMISRSSGYKIRENNFQHAIGLPAPNPWLRNTSNIIDPTQESNITVNEEEKSFEPIVKGNLETVEQQTAFNFACSSTPASSNTKRLTLKCLYETLLQNPQLVNNHSINSVNLERIIALLDCS